MDDFKYIGPDHPFPHMNMGASISEAILQAGTNYSTVVKPRVIQLLKKKEAKTTDGFLDLLVREGAGSLLNWKDTEKPRRIHQLTNLLSCEDVQNESDLKTWLQDAGNIEKLMAIKGVGKKTIDYLKILVGISTVAVDRHIFRFLHKAGIKISISEYDKARSIVNGAAEQMNLKASVLDHSIWFYMSSRSERQSIPKGETKIVDDAAEIGPYSKDEILLCSADAGPDCQRKEPRQAQYFFPGAKWVGATRNSADYLNCDFFIITTGHGLVHSNQEISPYDMHIKEYSNEVEAKWRSTIPAILGTGKYKVMIFYAGGCPRDEMLEVMLPILGEHGIDLLTFGRPNMFDVNKIENVYEMLVKGTSIPEIKQILKVPDRLRFYRGQKSKSSPDCSDMSTILTDRFQDALSYAFQLHNDQRRKGSETPYIAHLMSVAAIVLENGGDEDQAIAALLHDAVEDQGGIETLNEIKNRFGNRVAGIVKACSDSFTKPKPEWRERKEKYLASIAEKPSEAILVILADKLHNARAILNDYRELGDDLWVRFKGGRDGTIWYYKSIVEEFKKIDQSPLLRELEKIAGALEAQVMDR
jgi:hypothetical protein